MRVHDLAPVPGANKDRRRVGRGIAGKGGKTAGRGTKGQRSRGRGKVRVGFEGGQMPLKQRVPKLKGFTNPFRVEYSAVNLDTLEELADRLDGAATPESLAAAGAVRSGVFVKVLARGLKDGGFSRKLDVSVHAVSKAAGAAITAAGGTVTILPLPFNGENKAGRPAAKGNQFTNR